MLILRNKLNHAVEHLDGILNYTKLSPQTEEIAREYPYLQNIVGLLGQEIKDQLRNLDSTQEDLERIIYTIENSTGDDKSDAVSDYNKTLRLGRNYINRINDLLTQIDSPYFGRVDFKRNRTETFPEAVIKAYVGKFAYFDPASRQSLVTDWRAPISNLYYNNSGPTKNVSFISPLGTQTGDLLKKMQFDITGARLTNIYDAKTGNSAADAFLLAQLNRKIGKKLTDIVSTIQDQQNSIIREKTDKPVIIQGVAGSGKTTILLHRIAYLLYSKSKEITPKNSLIIAPNKMFLDYISDVLPSLGVHNIGKNTYIYWAKTILGWDDKYAMSHDKDDLEVKEFKGSALFIKIISDFIANFEEDLLNKIDDKLAPQIKARYFQLKESSDILSIEERACLSAEYAYAQKQYAKQITGNFMGNLEDQEMKVRNIKQYIRRRTNVFSLYKEMFKFSYIFKDRGLSEKFIKQLRDYSLKTLVKQTRLTYYKAEDVAPCLLIHYKLFGYKEHMRDYVAIDEAQDLSLFQLLTLYAIAKNSNMTIAGDLAQSIIPPFYIKDWNDVIELFNGNSYYHQLEKCYRTTVEIIDFANKLFERYFPKSYKLPQAVLRHGEDVHIATLEKPLYEIKGKELNELITIINQEFDKGAVTCAIVCRDFTHADKVYHSLKPIENKLNRSLSTYNEEDYHEGVLVLPVERAKGLEFDTVIIADLDKDHYTEATLDIRLLYVAMTRALHRLYILENKSVGKSILFEK